MRNLVWSPDGTHLLLDGRAKGGGGIYTVGVDGSHLILVIPAGNPVLENEGYGKPPRTSTTFDMVAAGRQADWSPDLSRIAYTRANGLVITDADGTHVQEFGYAGSGPWNPLSEASSDIAPATSLGATFDTRLLWGAVLLALGAIFVVIRRMRCRRSWPAHDVHCRDRGLRRPRP
jgi:hypothetical protein